jgi:hypothetical protein
MVLCEHTPDAGDLARLEPRCSRLPRAHALATVGFWGVSDLRHARDEPRYAEHRFAAVRWSQHATEAIVIGPTHRSSQPVIVRLALGEKE